MTSSRHDLRDHRTIRAAAIASARDATSTSYLPERIITAALPTVYDDLVTVADREPLPPQRAALRAEILFWEHRTERLHNYRESDHNERDARQDASTVRRFLSYHADLLLTSELTTTRLVARYTMACARLRHDASTVPR